MAPDKNRIAFVYNSAWYLYHFRSPLIKTMQAKGFEVHTISPADGSEKDLQEMGTIYHDLPLSPHGANPLREIKSLISLALMLKQIKPQLVISYTIKCNIYCGLIKKLFPFAQIVNIVGLGRAFEKKGIFSTFARFLYRCSIQRANAVFFQNKEDRDSFVEASIVPAEATVVTAGSGVNLQKFSVADPPGEKDSFVFFMFGRLIPAKGFDLFLSAAERFESHNGKNISFWIAGGLDGTQAASGALKDRLEKADLKGTISFLGHRSDIPELINAADVVVLPSTYNEGVPRSLLEALACGKPIITTDWKGCRETLDQSHNGRLIKPNDFESLYQAMVELSSLDAEVIARMGSHSRSFAERKFAQEGVIARYCEVINEILLPQDKDKDLV